MNNIELFLWEWSEECVRRLPSDFEPVPVTGWPVDVPVVVHALQAEQFRQEAVANRRPDGRLPDAILYLPNEPPMEPLIWADVGSYFDAVVVEGDWLRLRGLLACPKQFRMAELAEDVSVTMLERLADELDLRALAVVQDERRHLSECCVCRAALGQAIEERLEWRRRLLSPSDGLADIHSTGEAGDKTGDICYNSCVLV